MPTIAVDKQDLFDLLGRSYTTKEFDELCFQFGIELDEDTTEDVKGTDERPQLKIEIGANRYDMLCIEGIAQALNQYLGRSPIPNYTLSPEKPQTSLTIKESTSQIRPYAASAILRGITFTQRSYDSFIALQDKLHANLCRGRTLVAMGTHDLDTIQGPFTYEALPPKDIKFTPLNQTKEMNGEELMQFYKNDKNLGKYLPIIEGSPVYPVILDANRNVCSLPPIINSDLSKITLDTKNVFLDVTGTDRTKVEIVVNTLVAMFSRYCETPFTIEPVEIISEHNNETRICPNLEMRELQVEAEYINSVLALELSRKEICDYLLKMSLFATPNSENEKLIDVKIPITRSDVLHACDVMEDCAIAYGYDNLVKTYPKTEATTAYPLPVNKVGDILRTVSAQAGWLEVLPLTLCSHDENYKFLLDDDDSLAVKLENPKTVEYQIVRTSLVPGILKTIKENKNHALPIKVFESGDIVYKVPESERGAVNQRNWCAAYAGKNSGFENIQGLLTKIMQTMRVPWLEKDNGKRGFWTEGSDEKKMFFPGRGAVILYRAKDDEKAVKVGHLGVLHPQVLSHFEIPFALSIVEINAEIFL
ncbi:phenylalanine-tRNA ligase beta subunit [Pichia kudriavzevii]|uniref:Phenylalanine--tRNA ligase beta subunit n=1 Tax=Pichia kudriavzevii TaxID=4909 RepID=A0A1Z8JTP9_PICKU|nr:phenylalanine-tRNA ligase beta subunit [Pichia kudriavzevii]